MSACAWATPRWPRLWQTPVSRAFVETLARRDIAASLTPAAGLDVSAYIGQVLDRFRNPAIVHQLSQIAWDGSQKLPFRLLQTIAEARAAGRPVERLVVGVAGWMLFVRIRRRPAGPSSIPWPPISRRSGARPPARRTAATGRFAGNRCGLFRRPGQRPGVPARRRRRLRQAGRPTARRGARHGQVIGRVAFVEDHAPLRPVRRRTGAAAGRATGDLVSATQGRVGPGVPGCA